MEYMLNRNINNKIFLSVFIFGISMIFNPFYGLILVAISSFWIRFGNNLFIFLIVYLSLYLVARPYGVDWTLTEKDDALVYIKSFFGCSDATYFSLFKLNNSCNYGTEPGLFLIWWPIFNVFKSINFLIFFQIFFSLMCLYFAFLKINRKYAGLAFGVAILCTPNYLPMIVHIFRQFTALNFLLLFYIFSNRNILKYIFIIFSFFSHASAVFAILIFLNDRFMKIKNLLIMSLFFLLGLILVNKFYSELIVRVSGYSEAQDVTDFKFLIISWLIIYLFSYFYFENRFLFLKNFCMIFFIILLSILFTNIGLASVSRIGIYFQPLVIGCLAIVMAENRLKRLIDKFALIIIIAMFFNFFISSYIFNFIGNGHGRSIFSMYYVYEFFLNGGIKNYL